MTLRNLFMIMIIFPKWQQLLLHDHKARLIMTKLQGT